MSNLVNLERVSKAYGVRPLLTDVSLGVSVGERVGVVGRNGDGKTTLLQVLTGQEPPDSGRVSMSRGLAIGYLHQGDTLDDTHSVRDAVLAGQARPRLGRRAAHPRDRHRAAGRGRARPCRDRAVRRRTAALRPRRAAAARARPGRPRRAQQPPRRGGRRLAGRAPGVAAVGPGRGHPRPVVPRRGVPADLGGPRRGRGQLRGWVRRVRARQGRAAAAGGRHGGAPAQPGAQGAGVAAPWGTRADLEAEVPARRRLGPDRRRAAAARPARAPTLRHAAAGQGRDRRRGRRSGAR